MLFEKDNVIFCFFLFYVAESQTEKGESNNKKSKNCQEKIVFLGYWEKGGFYQKLFFEK